MFTIYQLFCQVGIPGSENLIGLKKMVGTSILGSWRSPHWFFGTKKTPPFFKSDWMDDLGPEASGDIPIRRPQRSGKKTIPSGYESYMENEKKLELMLKGFCWSTKASHIAWRRQRNLWHLSLWEFPQELPWFGRGLRLRSFSQLGSRWYMAMDHGTLVPHGTSWTPKSLVNGCSSH